MRTDDVREILPVGELPNREDTSEDELQGSKPSSSRSSATSKGKRGKKGNSAAEQIRTPTRFAIEDAIQDYHMELDASESAFTVYCFRDLGFTLRACLLIIPYSAYGPYVWLRIYSRSCDFAEALSSLSIVLMVITSLSISHRVEKLLASKLSHDSSFAIYVDI